MKKTEGPFCNVNINIMRQKRTGFGECRRQWIPPDLTFGERGQCGYSSEKKSSQNVF